MDEAEEVTIAAAPAKRLKLNTVGVGKVRPQLSDTTNQEYFGLLCFPALALCCIMQPSSHIAWLSMVPRVSQQCAALSPS